MSRLQYSLAALLTLSLLLFLFIVATPSAFAATIPTVDITKVRGHVIGSDGKPWKFARVLGTCDGKTTRGITNGQGNYLLIFVGKNTCAQGAHVHVTVTGDGKSADGDGTVVLDRDGRFVDMNLSVLNLNFNVPEFSLIPALLAGFGSITIYLVLRRKNKLALRNA